MNGWMDEWDASLVSIQSNPIIPGVRLTSVSIQHFQIAERTAMMMTRRMMMMVVVRMMVEVVKVMMRN